MKPPRQLDMLAALTPPVTVEAEGVTYDFVFLADGPECVPQGVDTIPECLWIELIDGPRPESVR